MTRARIAEVPRRTRRSLALGLLLAIVAPFLAFATAGAQEVDESLSLRSVDSRDIEDVKVDFLWTGDPGAVDSLELRENGQAVETTVEALPAGDPNQGIMFVVDTSRPMEEGNALNQAREGIRKIVEAAPEGTEFGIVAAGDTASVLVNLTSSKTQIYAVLDQISATQGDGGALWGSVKIAGASLASRNRLLPNIIVIAGSSDQVTSEMRNAAQGEVASSGSTMMVAGFTGAGFDTGAWRSLADRVGGAVVTTEDSLELAGPIETLGNLILENQYRISYSSPAMAEAAAAEEAEAAAAEEEGRDPRPLDQPAIDLTLEVGGRTDGAIVLPGGHAVGSSALKPTEIAESSGIEFLQGDLGLVITFAVVLVAAILLVFGLVSIFVRDDNLTSVLRPYSEGYGDRLDDDEDAPDDRSAFVQRAVEITEQVAESQGYLTRVEGALERASIPLRAGEALALYGAIVLLVMLLGLVLYGLVAGLILGVLAALLPPAIVNFKASRRRKQFLAQLPDMLQLLSGTLRAGYSLMQGVEAVAHESADPMGYELRRVVTESRLGRPLEEALESTAVRMDSPDFAWAVMAIRIQREVGGNLSELLLTVAETMIARERLRRDVAALTAEGRVSAVVLGALPVLVGLAIYTMNPGYMTPFLNSGLGIGLLIGAGIAMGIGFLWMKKIIDIEI